MNLRRRYEMRERRIVSMQKQIEKLTMENKALHSKNQELLDKEFRHQVQLDMIEELRRKFTESIAEMNTVKEQYQQAIYETRKMKKDFAKKFKPLIKQLKSFD